MLYVANINAPFRLRIEDWKLEGRRRSRDSIIIMAAGPYESMTGQQRKFCLKDGDGLEHTLQEVIPNRFGGQLRSAPGSCAG